MLLAGLPRPVRAEGGASGDGAPGGADSIVAGGVGGTGASSSASGGGGGAGATGGMGGGSCNGTPTGGTGGTVGHLDGGNGIATNCGHYAGGGGGGGAHAFIGASLPGINLTGGAGGTGSSSFNDVPGGGGGAGGYGALITAAASVVNSKTITGGRGGNSDWTGVVTITSILNGDGGSGGAGVAGNAFSIENDVNGVIRGGTGGLGDTGNILGGGSIKGGSGGRGGDGLSGSQLSILNKGNITGGTGGAGGPSSGGFANGTGASGGNGISGFQLTIVNLATIKGGSGGWTPDPSFQNAIAPGAGGTGISGSDLSITTSGLIAGGLSGDGTTRANAITFTGGSNSLELQAGYAFTGLVVGTSSDTLKLGGSTDAPFSLSDLGSEFVGFSQYEKRGSATWTLTGTTNSTGSWTIGEGTLKLASGADLSSATSVTVDSTLDVSAASNATVIRNLAGSAAGLITLGDRTLVVDQSTVGTGFAGAFAGTGNLIKRGAGDLGLSGVSSGFTGTISIEDGKLALTGAADISAATSVRLGATATLDVSSHVGETRLTDLSGATGSRLALGHTDLTLTYPGDDTFAGTISGTGTLTKQGGGVLTVTGDLSGLAGAVRVSAGKLRPMQSAGLSAARSLIVDGTLDLAATSDRTIHTLSGSSASAEVALGNQSLTIVQDADGTYAGRITGAGGLLKSGTATLTLTGTSGYSGDISVTSGKLVVGDDGRPDVRLPGTAVVSGTGFIGGFGTVGTLSVGAGGTVTPGNSIGTLRVAGNATLAAGSTLQAEITPDGQSDLLAVAGSAAVGGASVYVLKAAGNYAPGQRYTILTAGGGVVGTFASLSQNLPFLDLQLAYDANDVYLDIARNQMPFPAVGITGNEIATASAIEVLGPSNPLYVAVVNQTNVASARSAFAVISGEIHSSAVSTLTDESRLVRDAALDRARWHGALRTGNETSVHADGLEGTFWARGLGTWGRIEGGSNASSLRHDAQGVMVGYDTTLEAIGTLGFAAGYTSGRLSADRVSSSLSSDNYHAAIYGAETFGALNLRFGAALTWSDLSSHRNVVFPGFSEMERAGYTGRTTQAFGEIGYRLPVTGGMIEPFAGLTYVDVRTGGFRETGGAAALSSGNGASGATASSTLGAHAATRVDLFGIAIEARGTLGWQHAFLNSAPGLSVSLAGSPSFTVAGIPAGTDQMILEAGIEIPLADHAAFGLSLGGALAPKAYEGTAKGRLTWTF